MKDIYTTEDNFKKYAHIHSKCIIKGTVDNPALSIFIPTYNRPETIVDTIESVVRQKTKEVFEIVVVNNSPDGATDETRRIIESFNDNRLYYFVNEENIGLCGNWNRGLEICRAEYVAMIHDDDVLSPWFVNSLLEAIKEKDDAIIFGVKSILFDSKNKPAFSEPQELKYRKVSKKAFFFGDNITIAGMTVKRASIIGMGGYNDEYYPNEDTILIYRAIINSNVYNIENELAGYRKEINLSLSDKTMNQIIEKMEYTRRNIAQYEKFAKLFMRFFDREFLYLFVLGANGYWGTNVKVDEIMKKFEMQTREPNRAKLLIMRMLIRFFKM